MDLQAHAARWQCCKSTFVHSAQHSNLGLKLPPPHSLGSHLKASFSGLFRHQNCRVLLLHFQLSIAFDVFHRYPSVVQPVCTTATSPVLLCPANNAILWCSCFCHPLGSNWSMLSKLNRPYDIKRQAGQLRSVQTTFHQSFLESCVTATSASSLLHSRNKVIVANSVPFHNRMANGESWWHSWVLFEVFGRMWQIWICKTCFFWKFSSSSPWARAVLCCFQKWQRPCTTVSQQ